MLGRSKGRVNTKPPLGGRQKKKAEECARAGLKQKSFRITNVIIEAIFSYDFESSMRFGEYFKVRPFSAFLERLSTADEIQIYPIKFC